MLFFALKTELNNKISVRFNFSAKNYMFWSILNNNFISTKFMVNHLKPDRVVRVTTL